MNDLPIDGDSGDVEADFQLKRPQSGSRPSVYWEPPTLGELQEMLPSYEFLDLLGRGGMGAVFRARQLSLDRLVAIKVLPGDVFDDEDATFVQRFQNEARTMGRMNHPGIVNVFDFGEAVGTGSGQRLLYFVMEYVEGTDVSKMVLDQGRLAPAHALAIAAHVCDALTYAHGHGVIHRDIKPANVLINREGQVKVADFGLAKGAETEEKLGMTRQDVALGTPDYVAPEALVVGMESDHRGDLYAVGVMLYNMLTGEIPRGMFQLPSDKVGSDSRFDKIIVKAMQADRELRYQSAGEIRRALDEILTTPMVKLEADDDDIPRAVLADSRPMGQRPGPGGGVGRHSGPVKVQGQAHAHGQQVLPQRRTAPVQVMKHEEPTKPGWLIPALVMVPVLAVSGWFLMKPAVKVESRVGGPEPVLVVEKAPVEEGLYPRGKWVGVFTKAADVARFTQGDSPAMRFDPDGGMRFAKYVSLAVPEASGKDWGIRARFRMMKDRDVEVKLRNSANHFYGVRIKKGMASLVYHRRHDDKAMAGMSFPEPIKLDFLRENEEFDVEFFAVGKRLVARVANRYLGRAVDDKIEQGELSIYGCMNVRNIQVMRLDGMEEGEALRLARVDRIGVDVSPDAVPIRRPSAPPASKPMLAESTGGVKVFPPGEWVRLFEKWEQLPTKLRQDGESKMEADGWLTTKYDFHLNDFKVRNGGIRATFRKVDGLPSPMLRIRMNNDPTGGGYEYAIAGRRKVRVIQRGSGAFVTDIAGETAPNAASVVENGGEFNLELFAVGSRLWGRHNGEVVSVADHDRWSEGFMALFPKNQPVRGIEVINLDGLSEAEALAKVGLDEKAAADTGGKMLAAGKTQEGDLRGLPPEFAELQKRMEGLMTERVTGPYEQALKKLNAGYLVALGREDTNARQAGNLDEVLVFQQAAALVKSDALALVPAEDGAGVPEVLKRLRSTWRGTYAGIVQTREGAAKGLQSQFDAALVKLEATLTQQDRVQDALAVRGWREGMMKPGQAGTMATAALEQVSLETKPVPASPAPSPIPTPTPAKEVPKVAEAKTRDTEVAAGPGDAKAAALMVFSKEGTVEIQVGREVRTAKAESDLPERGFELVGVRMVGAAANRRPISKEEMQTLGGLRELKVLRMEYMNVEDEALRVLASLSALRELVMRENQSMTDEGLAILGTLKDLERLNLEGSRQVTSAGIGHLRGLKNLRDLHLAHCPKLDVAMLPHLADMKSLTLLSLHACLAIAGEDLERAISLPSLRSTSFSASQVETPIDLKAAKSLMTCRFYGNNPNDLMTEVEMITLTSSPSVNHLLLDGRMLNEGHLVRLGEMPGLTSVMFQNVALPGSGLTSIKGGRIERVGLRGMRFTDGMLAEMAQIKSLKVIEIFPGTQVTAEGLAKFSKLRADVRIDHRS
ncbi:hypothetical protein FEM03_10455 [Phragmitibacter flavus]|uniref:Protein kinase domain-containing protein n=1 Tax=Phragmitibacter flavus TaxID=2576071 RepID=A0A5R8KEK0_9BACT|nr:protein kinase [Phragmitibacter flavus]TLD70724.1 hypothetical protein FEM03_10455 [Phragmitibacter flavus]